MKKITPILKKIDFIKKGRYFVHEKCPYYIDFVNPPVAIGNEPVHHYGNIHSTFGTLILLTPTDCVKDRLAAFYHWDDKQALEQAILVAETNNIDIENIKQWSKNEGHLNSFKIFIKQIKKLR